MIRQARSEAHLAAWDRTPISKIGKNLVTAHELVKLECEWLNDDLVNAYAALIVQREAKKGNKIAVMGNNFYTTWSKRGWSSVQRWPNKSGCGPADMKNCTRVFVPVNPGVHWLFGCINLKQRRFEVYDSLNNRSVLRAHSQVYQVRLVLLHPA